MKKFSLKAAAVAAAMVVSGAASAATSGDLYVVVYDSASTNTFVADLGSVVTPTSAALNTSLASDAGWSTFASAAGANLASDTFLLVGGASRVGDISFGTAPTAAPAASGLNSIFGATIVTLLTNALNSIATGTTSADLSGTGSGTWSSIGGSTNLGGLVKSGVVGGVLGATQSLVYFPTTSANFSTVESLTLSTTGALGPVSTSPTPEPGTYALMAAGLLAVGAIVRRRARA